MKVIARNIIRRNKDRNMIFGKLTDDEKVYLKHHTSSFHWLVVDIEFQIEKMVI